MRLTGSLIDNSSQFVNPLFERELDLRGNKIGLIENLGLTKDQFDSIDMSDNEIEVFGNFPVLVGLKRLFLNNNRVHKVDWGLSRSLPELRVLSLMNNNLVHLEDLEPLGDFASSGDLSPSSDEEDFVEESDKKKKNMLMMKKEGGGGKLEHLSLLDNVVCRRENYRLYVISLVPQLKSLDFKKVKQVERIEAMKLFKKRLLSAAAAAADNNNQKKSTSNISKESIEEVTATIATTGEVNMDDMHQKKQRRNKNKKEGQTFIEEEKHTKKRRIQQRQLSHEEKEILKEALLGARTLHEIQRYEEALRLQKLPKELQQPHPVSDNKLSSVSSPSTNKLMMDHSSKNRITTADIKNNRKFQDIDNSQKESTYSSSSSSSSSVVIVVDPPPASTNEMMIESLEKPEIESNGKQEKKGKDETNNTNTSLKKGGKKKKKLP